MDKQKVIKIAIASIIGICAIVYYFSNNQESTTYENILSDNIIVENNTKEEVLEEKAKIKVYVTGEVNVPGVIELEEGARIQDAIEGAGGITAEAKLKNINLAYEISDGEKIYIPNLSEVDSEDVNGETISAESDSKSTSENNSNKKININKATENELTSIPGIGKSTAEKIITYREENGKFKSIEDLKNVSGIGNSKYEKMKDYISVK